MNQLVEKIRSLIRSSGPITFERFMEMALYDPEHGYYQSRGNALGRHGDFTTSPESSRLFGRLLGMHVLTLWRKMGQPAAFSIIEYGPGRGLLCRDLMDLFQQLNLECFHAVTYWLIERSLAQREELRRSLSKEMLEKGKARIAAADSEIDAAGGPQTILANEFLDALPAHWVVKKQGNLHEMYVCCDQGQLKEVEGELSTPALKDYFQWLGIELAEGQETTVNLNALRWIESTARNPGPTSVVLIDYGHLAEVIYANSSRSKTIACYHRHSVNFQPLRRVGMQDITTHVDFSALIKRAQELGFQIDAFMSQGRFLLELMAKEVVDWEACLDARLELKELIHPEGMGEKFQVLRLSKGFDTASFHPLFHSFVI